MWRLGVMNDNQLRKKYNCLADESGCFKDMCQNKAVKCGLEGNHRKYAKTIKLQYFRINHIHTKYIPNTTYRNANNSTIKNSSETS